MIGDKTPQRGSSASAAPFRFGATQPLTTCISQHKKMKIPESPSNIAFHRIDADNQRFYLTSRDFRSHLVEAKGLLKRVDDAHTQVSGEVFGTVRSTLLTALLAAIVPIFFIAILLSPWALIAVLVLGVAAALYWLSLNEQVEADKAELIGLFGNALSAVDKPAVG